MVTEVDVGWSMGRREALAERRGRGWGPGERQWTAYNWKRVPLLWQIIVDSSSPPDSNYKGGEHLRLCGAGRVQELCAGFWTVARERVATTTQASVHGPRHGGQPSAQGSFRPEPSTQKGKRGAGCHKIKPWQFFSLFFKFAIRNHLKVERKVLDKNNMI